MLLLSATTRGKGHLWHRRVVSWKLCWTRHYMLESMCRISLFTQVISSHILCTWFLSEFVDLPFTRSPLYESSFSFIFVTNNKLIMALQWRHNERDSVSNHQPHDCLFKDLFRRRSNETSKLRVTGLCAGNSPGTGEFPTQMASNAENVSIWWRHHGLLAPYDEIKFSLDLTND